MVRVSVEGGRSVMSRGKRSPGVTPPAGAQRVLRETAGSMEAAEIIKQFHPTVQKVINYLFTLGVYRDIKRRGFNNAEFAQFQQSILINRLPFGQTVEEFERLLIEKFRLPEKPTAYLKDLAKAISELREERGW